MRCVGSDTTVSERATEPGHERVGSEEWIDCENVDIIQIATATKTKIGVRAS